MEITRGLYLMNSEGHEFKIKLVDSDGDWFTGIRYGTANSTLETIEISGRISDMVYNIKQGSLIEKNKVCNFCRNRQGFMSYNCEDINCEDVFTEYQKNTTRKIQ